MEPVRVLLADDHTLFRKGVRTILEQMSGIDVVAEAANGTNAVSVARELVPDVILMDIKMPGLSGIEATKAVLQENPHIGVVAKGGHDPTPLPHQLNITFGTPGHAQLSWCGGFVAIPPTESG